MAIYEITSDTICEVEPTSFEKVGLRERADLQRLLRTRIGVIAPDLLVITEEFGEWEDSKRRIDLLALDRDANLVVIELKRTDDGGHMELQAIRYAAMVSSMTFEKVVELYANFLLKVGSAIDARQSILDFLAWDESDEDSFAQDVRIILVSADFSKELTTTVMWLVNEHDLDITCIRMRPYTHDGKVLIDVQQVIPLPEAEDYIVKIKEKEVRERTARREKSNNGELFLRFWSQLLERAKGHTTLHANLNPTTATYLAKWSQNLGWTYAFGKQFPRVELAIFGKSEKDAKAVFDQLFTRRDEIERRFGAQLTWDRADDQRTAKVYYGLSNGSVRNEQNWAALQDELIETMIKFENAFHPTVDVVLR